MINGVYEKSSRVSNGIKIMLYFLLKPSSFLQDVDVRTTLLYNNQSRFLYKGNKHNCVMSQVSKMEFVS
jgi:hypothetical protein